MTDAGPVHLFVCWPNAGSTLAVSLLEQSPTVSSIGIEGQMLPGFAELAPVPMKLGAAMLFTEVADQLGDAARYDWPAIVAMWTDVWVARGPDAPVRVEKSTPDVCRAQLLAQHFPPAAFVFGWRNPYAQVEGIMRGRQGVEVERAARHALECLRWQRRNLDWAGGTGMPHVAISYEELCADPAAFSLRCSDMLGVDIVGPPDEILVKGETGPVTDANQAQIERLAPAVLASVTDVLATDEALVESFGYRLLG